MFHKTTCCTNNNERCSRRILSEIDMYCQFYYYNTRSTCIWKQYESVIRKALFENLHVDPDFHNNFRNKRVECNSYIYTLSILYRFGYDILSNTQQGDIQNINRLIRHGNSFIEELMSTIFLCSHEENTGSVNITLWETNNWNSIIVHALILYREWNLLLNVTCNDISVIYVTPHGCASGLRKKLNLRSGSQRHRHFVLLVISFVFVFENLINHVYVS